MQVTELHQLLEDLSPESWDALTQGQSLVLRDDERLELTADYDPNILIPASSERTAEALRASVLADVPSVYDEYYRTHPLTRQGFDSQVAALIEKHGAEAFAAVYPATPRYSLFVNGGVVVAEGVESPRHRYGASCELDEPLTGAVLVQYVTQWLLGGEAYEAYISMNVCRYGCGV